MGVVGFRQVMDVEQASDLIVGMGKEGDIAYAWDVKKHFMYDGGNWIQISDRTQAMIDAAVAPKADISSISPVGFSGSYSDLSNKPPTPSQSAATRALNTAFQVSTTRNSQVVYSVTISNTVSLTGGSAGGIVLEIATNSGFTSGVQELSRVSNSNTGTLVVGLVLTDAVSQNLKGYIPAGYYVRLRTFNTTGTPTYTYVSGQEVWL